MKFLAKFLGKEINVRVLKQTKKKKRNKQTKQQLTPITESPEERTQDWL